MKIIKIEIHVLSNQLEQSFFFSQWAYNERRICVVKITTDEGVYGWGEGYGPADVIRQGIALLEPILIGLAIIILASGLLGYSNTLS